MKMVEKMVEFKPEKMIKEFEEISKNAGKIQEETLKKILEENRESEYLKEVGLNGRTDAQSFKQCVPLVTHKDLEPYIQRIMDGDSSPILTRNPIPTFSLSSGTTQGKRKFIPFNDELFENTMQIQLTSFAYRNREYPVEKAGKALVFLYSSKQFITKGGLPAGTATTNVFRHRNYKELMKGLQFRSCSPEEVICGPDFHEALYCHLLCALLYHNEVQFISSTFAHSIVQGFQTFELIWEDLCTDIRFGILNERVTDPSIRAAISKILSPNPTLADIIHDKCSGLSKWYGLIPELFPNAKYVYGIMTGAMEPYVKQLRKYAGWLPLICGDYGSSEGWVAANVNPSLPPESATFAVLPDIGYFEFIPLDDVTKQSEPKPLGLIEVKIGETYEIVITTFGGLYRYRLGDAVKVMGFHNSTPELKFVCRQNLMLSINIDKNTEKDLQLSVEEASKILVAEKIELIDFTSNVELSKQPGHYVIFWELSSEPDGNVLQECCNCLDRSFLDAGYVSSRKVGMIGPLELRIVRKGTFYKVMSYCLNMGNTLNQFKTPRFIGSNNKVLSIVSSNVANCYFSTAY
ncbi:jasmonoyl--L-amino acid synthetase JAR4 [Amaranthus tricolor]|uniref:jasmonoyl--L-amino acid synthetase JAR4 n=1 Tax=Amaranthus tricolor TaxID=29722 RepID=UPI0025911401|nr:jasmonoyl--L-amino acid synthetase JAR4 [Amaranthus tricolor]XP_057532369.1 jasmonoyl--L-amino acid synthetase JAR4 [Amaranthus tricolor]XP_057532370.1 jasmonoyl--L-amino acid synthetase JAR4 [Amaranthus tricolor]XP_057532371.1 jasmonoyl--L-amino acid synthetase JAR4 [Amaranthus tricolor]